MVSSIQSRVSTSGREASSPESFARSNCAPARSEDRDRTSTSFRLSLVILALACTWTGANRLQIANQLEIAHGR